ncbi:MAG: hypothetical protein AKCLJLPJ_02484 [Fimbriimonadales bacterium]|nr:hypothetical protein [Fimbriimonadales bacterium]
MKRPVWVRGARAGTVLAAVFAHQAGTSLGWNVDFDNRGFPPVVGGGVPSDSYGAASGQQGRWNSIPATAGGAYPLADTSGSFSGVTYHGDGMSGGGGGYNDPYNIGDYRLLMNDYNNVDAYNWFYLTGLPNGNYRVFTYAASVSGRYAPLRISVSGAAEGQNPQVVTGPAPPNEFAYLVTHAIHDVSVTDGTLRWEFLNQPWVPGTVVNGFQVVPVPEPGGLISIGGAVTALLIGRRRFRPRRAKEQT